MGIVRQQIGSNLLVAVAVLFALLIPGTHGLTHYSPPDDTVLDDRAPRRLIVKVKTGFQVLGAKSVPATVADLQTKTRDLGSPDISPLVPDAAIDNAGLSASSTTPHPASTVFLLDFPRGVNLASIRARIEAQPWVEYVEYDRLMHLFGAPDDPLFIWQWGLQNTGQTFPVVDRLPGYYNDTIAWVNGTPGFDVDFGAIYDHPGPRAPVIVGIMDTGSDTGHEDLADRLWRNPDEIPDNGKDDDHNGYVDDYRGYDFSGDVAAMPNEIMPDSDPHDEIGHGTHVAGIVAAVTDNTAGVAGLAGSAEILTLKVFPNAFNSVIARAVYYGAANGVQVFNMSFGSPFASKTVADALAYARSRGVLPIAASGNSGTETENFPSADPAAVAVGALDYLGQVAEFSTYGDQLDFVAPGVSILSLRAAGTDLYAGGGEPDVHIIAERYLLADGTSMSTPHVVGITAALLSIEAGLSPESLLEIIKNSCIDIIDPYGAGESYPGWDIYSGHGLVSLGRAINELAGLTLRINSPHEGDVLSGTVTIKGMAAGSTFAGYQLEYGPGDDPVSWTMLFSSTEPVFNETILTWNTAGLTGTYTLRLRADPGHEDRVTITLANASLTHLASPKNGDTISLVQTVYGSTIAPDYEFSVVSYAPENNPGDTTIAWFATAPVVDDSICAWVVNAEIEGWYYLKLTTAAASRTQADSVLVYIKNPFHSGWPVSIPAYAFYAPAAADLDGDGKMEFIVPTSRGLYVFEDDGRVADGWPRDTLISFLSIPAVADLDQDSRHLKEIIIASEDYIHIYTFFGEQYYLWPREFSGAANLYGVAVPLVCDLDGDYISENGIPEILAIDRGGIIRAFNDDGSAYVFKSADGPLVVETFYTGIASVPRASVIDMDFQGQNELVVSADGIWIWDAKTGAPYHHENPKIRDYKASFGMAVGNFDRDVQLEIAVAYITVGSHIFHLEVLEVDGTTLPGWPVSTGLSDEDYLLNSLSAGDVDGDGLPEIFIAPYFIGEGFILAYHADGTPLLPENQDGRFIRLAGSSSPVSLADVTGDGQPEIVIKVGEFFFGDEYLYALTPDGEFVPGYPLRFGFGIGTQLAAPLSTDLNGDGLLNMLTLESSGQVVTAWDFSVDFSRAGRPWAKFRRDNWNSGVIPSLRLYQPPYIVRLINYMFKSTPMYFPPYETPDANCDGWMSLPDLVVLINYIYRMGPEPCLP